MALRKKGEKPRGPGHTSLLQKQYMVEWLKNPDHFNIIVGKTSERTSGFGGAQTKLSGFGRMAEFVYDSCIRVFSDQGEPAPIKYTVKWDARTCQSRWTSYFKTYKTTKHRLDSQTGFGTNESEVAEGKTLQEAVEEACPFFYVLDELFGERQNIHPYSVHDSYSIASQQTTQSQDIPSTMLSFNLAQSTTFETDSTPTPSQGHETSNDDDSANFVSATPASRCELSESSNDGDSDLISSGIEVESAMSAQSLLESASPGSLSTAAGPRDRCWTTGSSAARSAKAMASEKANQAKKRDFASTFREFSEKRLEAETQWRRAEIDESRANRLASQEQANKDREERQEDRKFRFKETQSQLRRDMFIQLLERGRSEDDALTLLDRIFPA